MCRMRCPPTRKLSEIEVRPRRCCYGVLRRFAFQQEQIPFDGERDTIVGKADNNTDYRQSLKPTSARRSAHENCPRQ